MGLAGAWGGMGYTGETMVAYLDEMGRGLGGGLPGALLPAVSVLGHADSKISS